MTALQSMSIMQDVYFPNQLSTGCGRLHSDCCSLPPTLPPRSATPHVCLSTLPSISKLNVIVDFLVDRCMQPPLAAPLCKATAHHCNQQLDIFYMFDLRAFEAPFVAEGNMNEHKAITRRGNIANSS